jgi:hypothetical protein
LYSILGKNKTISKNTMSKRKKIVIRILPSVRDSNAENGILKDMEFCSVCSVCNSNAENNRLNNRLNELFEIIKKKCNIITD